MIAKELSGARTFILRLEKGEELNSSIERFCDEKGLNFCALEFIGSVMNPVLAYWDVEKQEALSSEFGGAREILGIGNVTLKDGKRWAHIHAFIGDRDKNAKVGHLVSGRVAVTLEVVVTAFNEELSRVYDPGINYKVWGL